MVRKRVFGVVVFLLAVMGLFFVFRLVGTPASAQAHGAFTDRIHAGAYDVEIGRESEVMTIGNFERFNINLIATSSQEVSLPYTSLWARLEGDDRILWATWLTKPEGLLSGFSYLYENPGDYVLRMRFVRGTTTLTETEYHFTVLGGGFSLEYGGMLLVGILIGGVLMMLMGEYRLKRGHTI